MVYVVIFLCQVGASLLIIAEMLIPSFGLLTLSSAGLFFYSYFLLHSTNPSFTPVLVLVNLFSIPAVIVYATTLIGSSPAALRRRLEGAATFGKETAVSPGDHGVAQTALRPVGKARFKGGYYDVISREGLLPKGTPVVVYSVKSAKIVVIKDSV
ncbi:NfeD family protein [Chitinivibrio alkaliphilus]|uniref:NfeD-like C-terminal domain-containing protein n=1 Tax=Chitinivibrio alkaliphilus ACht1 TaxID=1313304 RepID=U7D7H8_9BACT|nr:NfeD family protein [Chitinivibrio alkaliphilus]ERP31057.1 hypothetical protein CALK_2086 [Chitinivibrio alkaliphilus ACht1]